MVLDTLEILIEADKSGLETQLKRAGQNITGFVSQMNSQEVNWTQILSRSISPAVISGIATMFALAISKSLQFEDTAKKVGETTGLTGDALATMMKESKALAGQTGIDANDIAKAYGSIVPVVGDVSVANQLVSDASKLAAGGFGSVGDIVKSVIPLLQKWGVTTVDQAHAFMNSMADAASVSGQSIVSIASGFDQHSESFLRAGLKLASFRDLIISYGAEAAKIGQSRTDAVFAAIGGAIDNSNPFLSTMLGGSQHLKDVIVNGGIASAIAGIGDKWRETGAPVQFLAQQFGLSETAVNGFLAGSEKFPEIQAAIKKTEDAQVDLNKRFEEGKSKIDDLKIAWQQLVTTLTSSTVIDFLTSVVKYLKDAVEGFDTLFTKEGRAGFDSDMDAAKKSQQMLDDAEKKTFPSITKNLQDNFKDLGFTDATISKIENISEKKDVTADLLKLSRGGSDGLGNQTNNFLNNFSINSQPGAEKLTADNIVKLLYDQFQGMH